MTGIEATIEGRLLDGHAEVLAETAACADVVASQDARPLSDGADLRNRLRAVFAEAGLKRAFATVLTDTVESAGFSLPAPPVPSPPYVVVTSRGPVLRATIAPGRVVVRLDVFTIVDDGDTQTYERVDGVETTVSLVSDDTSTRSP
ncbi:hypothetical protein OB905_02160 [Halobacteria archaeon AArc-dxtr1]|nr:hypothetical protein [Halobacteria archaeon AArc-dxtr1]